MAHCRFFTSQRLSRQLAVAAICALAVIFTCAPAIVFAQRSMTRKFPASRNVKLQLINVSGTVTVEGWNRDEIKLAAEMDSPTAQFTPRMNGDTFVIDVKSENQGRSDIGDVNFKLWVPANSSVDIETGRGNIAVTGVNGNMVRAHVWLSGDIELLDIHAGKVWAENTSGDITFDGTLNGSGAYEFRSTQGNINIRLPGDATFNLMASSPTRGINLGAFDSSQLNRNDQRRVYGRVGNGGGSLIVFNQKGRIAFFRR